MSTMTEQQTPTNTASTAPPLTSDPPKRVQMTRHRPWRAAHPDAVIVDRRTRWGNPFKVGTYIPRLALRRLDRLMTELGLTQQVVYVPDADDAVELFRLWLAEHPDLREQVRRELAGRDLACWCPLTEVEGRPVPCHADVLLQVANAGQFGAGRERVGA